MNLTSTIEFKEYQAVELGRAAAFFLLGHERKTNFIIIGSVCPGPIKASSPLAYGELCSIMIIRIMAAGSIFISLALCSSSTSFCIRQW
jgi:hypothetical protein